MRYTGGKSHLLADRVLIRQQTKVKHGKAHYYSRHGQRKAAGRKVVAVGKGKVTTRKVLPIEVKVGDQILYGKYSARKLKSTSRIISSSIKMTSSHRVEIIGGFIMSKQIKYGTKPARLSKAAWTNWPNAVKATLGPKGRYVVLDRNSVRPPSPTTA